ncbi:hypothetical protein AB0I35_31325 [Nocardia sp. NPDC050378]|uniref:hypothetical protein n=1 Tax=Nocardia sp. NPDC050378 TaxID=3155400 RepID=UPI0033C815D2
MPSRDLLPGHGAGWLDPIQDPAAEPEEVSTPPHRGRRWADEKTKRAERPSRGRELVAATAAAAAGATIGAGLVLLSDTAAPPATAAR